MHLVRVQVTHIEWDVEGVHAEDVPMLPATYTHLDVLVDDASNDEEINSEVMNALVREFDYLVKDVGYVITWVERVPR